MAVAAGSKAIDHSNCDLSAQRDFRGLKSDNSRLFPLFIENENPSLPILPFLFATFYII